MYRIYLFFIFNLFFFSFVYANNQDKIDMILKLESAPFGVVFEIVESDKDALAWAIPRIKNYSVMLRKSFPNIGIAVVSHGKEQFSLIKSEKKQNNKIHSIIESLVKDDAIPVHVCGTHASWYQIKEEDFPGYIDVTPAGPTAINNYVDMGYVLIILKH